MAVMKQEAVLKRPVRKKAIIADMPPVPSVLPLETPLAVSKYSFEEAKKKWKILNPETLKWVNRDSFVQKCLGEADLLRPLEDTTQELTREVMHAKGKKSEYALNALACTYIDLRDKSARLPKFGKWVTSMYKDDKDFATILSKAAQSKGGNVVISADIIDILRAGSSKHYYSCLGPGGGFNEVLQGVCEQCPGIFVAYIDHVDGDMKWRSWLHHIVVNGEDAVGAMSPYGQGGSLAQVAKLLADKGIKLYRLSNYERGDVVECVGAFTQSIHWDLYTWKEVRGTLVKPLE